MWEPLLLFAALAAAPDCDALAGWHAGRHGDSADARCDEQEYREAHRLGSALKALRDEYDSIARDLPTLTPEAGAVARRRQRQLAIDLEAIRGLATIKAWPLGPTPESTP